MKDFEREHTRIMVGEAIRNTRDFRLKIVEMLNETECSIGDGALAFLTLAATHLKDNEITREEFLELCDIIYVSAEINYGDGDDEVKTSRIN